MADDNRVKAEFSPLAMRAISPVDLIVMVPHLTLDFDALPLALANRQVARLEGLVPCVGLEPIGACSSPFAEGIVRLMIGGACEGST